MEKQSLLKSTKNEIIFFSDIHKVLLFTICIVYNEFLRQKLFWESSFRKVVYIGKRKKLFNRRDQVSGLLRSCHGSYGNKKPRRRILLYRSDPGALWRSYLLYDFRLFCRKTHKKGPGKQRPVVFEKRPENDMAISPFQRDYFCILSVG